MARIFLCHANQDNVQVEDLYNRLRDLGFEPWMDKKDLISSQRWQQEIPRALKSSAMVLVCLSQNIGWPGFGQREFKLAVDTLQEIPEDVIHTIPVRLEPCDIPEPFTALHWCNLFEPDGFDRLLVAIHHGFQQHGEPISAPPDPVIARPPSFTNSIGMEFVLIPAGEFMMGSPDLEPNTLDREKPAHQVTISEPFYLGKYPVTQAQWQAVMGTNPSDFKGEDCPVETVSWEDTQAFMQTLNEREGVSHYRLPTEAQWEYACRAGSNTVYHFGDDEARLGEYAWYSENSCDETHPVGQKKPNAWGLYDMHGNVIEWVQDWYAEAYYRNSPTVDPRGLDTGAYRVFRGGSWDDSAQDVRATYRLWDHIGFCADDIGFRCSSSGGEPASGAKQP